MKLSPTVPFMPGETPESFVSRLARINRIANSRMFCTDLGLSYRGVLDGKRDVLERVADLVDMDPQPLFREAVTKADRAWTVRGQTLAGWSVARDARRVCPVCLIDDQDKSGLPGGVAAYFRTTWHVAHIRACPTHACGLVELPKVADPFGRRDFAALIGPQLGRLRMLNAGVGDLAPSPFEAYLLGRLDCAGDAFRWLDAMPFHVAAQACEVVGGVVAIGRRARRKFLDEPDRRRAGVAGFEILSGGPEALVGLLDELRRTAPGAKGGPSAWFGDIICWMREGAKNNAFAPVRDVVLRYLVDTTPMKVGYRLLGETIDAPRMRSVRTVKLDTGLHAQTVKRLLAGAGHLAGDEVNSPGKTLLPAGAPDDLIRRMKGSLPQRQLLSLLGISQRQTTGFLASMRVKPIVAKSDATTGWLRYAREDVETLLQDLRGEAPEMDEAQPGSVSLNTAARRANAPIDRLMEYVLDGRLACTGWSSAHQGLRGVFVDLEAAKAACREPELDGLMRFEIQRRLGINHYTVEALIEAGLLPTVSRIHPAKRYPVIVVPKDAFERFEATYVKLHKIAAMIGLHPRKAKAALDQAGAVPVLAGGGKIATVYRRDDVSIEDATLTSRI